MIITTSDDHAGQQASSVSIHSTDGPEGHSRIHVSYPRVEDVEDDDDGANWYTSSGEDKETVPPKAPNIPKPSPKAQKKNKRSTKSKSSHDKQAPSYPGHPTEVRNDPPQQVFEKTTGECKIIRNTDGCIEKIFVSDDIGGVFSIQPSIFQGVSNGNVMEYYPPIDFPINLMLKTTSRDIHTTIHLKAYEGHSTLGTKFLYLIKLHAVSGSITTKLIAETTHPYYLHASAICGDIQILLPPNFVGKIYCKYSGGGNTFGGASHSGPCDIIHNTKKSRLISETSDNGVSLFTVEDDPTRSGKTPSLKSCIFATANGGSIDIRFDKDNHDSPSLPIRSSQYYSS